MRYDVRELTALAKIRYWHTVTGWKTRLLLSRFCEHHFASFTLLVILDR